MKKKTVAIIGCGNIANFHIPALRKVGVEFFYCASSLNSKTIHQFATNHKIKKVWTDPVKLAKAADQWDAVIISSSIEPTYDLLKITAASGKPVLVEKPVATSSSKLVQFSVEAPPNVIVGYNRRFYNTIQKAKQFVNNKPNIRAIMTLPENVSPELKDPYHNVRSNSVHGIDLLNYIFGEMSIEYISTTNSNNPFFGRQVFLKSINGHQIILLMNWRSPANFTLCIDDAKQRLDLITFEKYQLFEGMNIVESSNEYPIKQYVPNKIESSNVFNDMPLNFKPGFLGQAKEFYCLINGKSPKIAASLRDAYNAQSLVENILKFSKT